MRAVLGARVEAAREVRVQDVKPARPELELPGLDVDDDLVSQLDGPCQARVRNRRLAVDLETSRVVVLLADSGDRAPPKAEWNATRPGMTRPAADR